MNTDSKNPRRNLSMKSPAKESMTPLSAVQALHKMHERALTLRRLKWSATTPPNIPKVANEAEKAKPESTPYH